MKFLKILFLMALVATFTACGDDEEDLPTDCVQADWVGTYTGTSSCTASTGDEDDATVIITASGTDAVIVVTIIPGLESEYDPIVIDACRLEFSDTDSGITLSVDAMLDGDELIFDEIFEAGGQSETCTIIATRN